MHSDVLGQASIIPAGSFPVGMTGTWKITYIVGRHGMDDGGSILIAQRDMTDGGRLQCDSPGEQGFVSAKTDGDACVQASYDAWRWIRPWRGAVLVKVFDGSLSQGDKIVVTLGDTTGGSPGWDLQTFPETSHEFRVLVDPYGTRLYRPIAEQPFIRIIPSEASYLDAIVSSRVAPGRSVDVQVRVLDRWSNPIRDFEADVELAAEPAADALAQKCHLDRASTFAGKVCFSDEGVQRLRLTSGDLSGWGNPVEVTTGATPIFWADLHGQTQDAIGTGTVKEYFEYARNWALIDASSWQGNDFQVTDESWRDVCLRTREFNEPGRFVTFLGYEWSGPTPSGGDHNVLYLSDGQQIHRSSLWQINDGERSCSPISELWREFNNRKDVMTAAHAGGRYANLDYWNPQFCRLIEVHSNHGTFEWLVEEALRRGYVFGVVGGSDDHSGRPGWSPPLRRGGTRGTVNLDMFGGLTGIYANELTRSALWAALRSGHCYATTGCRILLDVRSGKSMMGDVVQGCDAPRFSLSASGSEPILDVEIRREDGKTFHKPFEVDADSDWIRVDWSGLRVRSRNRRLPWDAALSVRPGRIIDYMPLGFWGEGDELLRLSASKLAIKCTTVGNVLGVFLRPSRRDARIRFESAGFSAGVPMNTLGSKPVEYAAGCFNAKVRFSIRSPHDRPMSADLQFEDPERHGQGGAYWTKLLQIDGHSAWSSPMFFQRP